ncbi:MAG: hypothetical protein K9H49_12045 [Bacteroidales bacterium]|nr:hypothetical protein [Bacteroidales bacterium]MCF8390785.1 hypothetical protein [Bacteroidales bacterium]
MRIILYIVLLFVSQDINYKELFCDDYTKALEFIEENKELIATVCNSFENDPLIISSIVFPEAIRYSMIRDYFETASLELAYVSTGAPDFSIGSFQIKPSFAEKIEYYVKNNMHYLEPELLHWFSYEKDLKEFQIRKIRLDRLKSTEAQLYYINAFYRILLHRFSFLTSCEKEYRIKFTSTAYNHNFEADSSEIEVYMSKSFFPWGANNEKQKFNYADIAWDYYARIVE